MKREKGTVSTSKKETRGHKGKNPYINERYNLLACARELVFAAPGKYVSSSNGGSEETRESQRCSPEGARVICQGAIEIVTFLPCHSGSRE